MATHTEIPTLPEALDALADAASFSSDEQLAVAARRLMAKHARKLYKHLPGALEGEDPHHVHQARVATRRLRASLQATAPAYRIKPVKRLRKQLRRLAQALGAVRDYDVLLQRVREDIEELPAPERPPLQAVVDQMQRERDDAHAALVAEIQHKRTAALLDNLNYFLLCPIEDVEAQADELPLLVRHYAGSAIWQRFEEVRRFETLMPQASSTQLHELRIACKHLRYTLELFEPALPKAGEDSIGRVTAMQEHLGVLHDIDVAIEYFRDKHGQAAQSDLQNDGTVSPDGEISYQVALDHYVSLRQQERDDLLSGIPKLWDSLTLVTPRRCSRG